MFDLTIEKANNGYIVRTHHGVASVWSDPRDVLRYIVEYFDMDNTVLALEALDTPIEGGDGE